MKTVTKNTALPVDLYEFAEGEMRAGSFSTFSEYVRDLIRQRRQKRIDKDVALIEKAGVSLPVGEPDLAALYADVRKHRRKPRG